MSSIHVQLVDKNLVIRQRIQAYGETQDPIIFAIVVEAQSGSLNLYHSQIFHRESIAQAQGILQEDPFALSYSIPDSDLLSVIDVSCLHRKNIIVKCIGL